MSKQDRIIVVLMIQGFSWDPDIAIVDSCGLIGLSGATWMNSHQSVKIDMCVMSSFFFWCLAILFCKDYMELAGPLTVLSLEGMIAFPLFAGIRMHAGILFAGMGSVYLTTGVAFYAFGWEVSVQQFVFIILMSICEVSLVYLYGSRAFTNHLSHKIVMRNNCFGDITVDLRSQRIVNMTASIISHFDSRFTVGAYFSDLPQQETQVSLHALVEAHARGGDLFATLQTQAGEVDCKLVPFLKTSHILMVNLLFQGEVRPRQLPEVPPSHDVDMESLDRMTEFVPHRSQELAPQGNPTPRYAKSSRSAPAAPLFEQTESQLGIFEDGIQCMRGDCLRPDALVWLEGEALPKPLCQVLQGERVLCYDSLGSTLKHVPVNAIKITADSPTWVLVKLMDGTVLHVTSDHQFYVQATPSLHSEEKAQEQHSVPHGVVRASDLVAGRDGITVLKAMPITVQSVEHCTDDSLPNTRVSLAVHQPERHSIFVGPPGSRSFNGTMAVCSADIDERFVFPDSTRTFVDVKEDPEIPRRFPRPSSAPPIVVGTAACLTELAIVERTVKACDGHNRRHKGVDSASSTSEMLSSLDTASHDTLLVCVGPTSLGTSDRKISLQSMLQVPRCPSTGAATSLGSAAHFSSGACTPCSWIQRGRSCRYSWLCPYCHILAGHKPFRSARQRRKEASEPVLVPRVMS